MDECKPLPSTGTAQNAAGLPGSKHPRRSISSLKAPCTRDDQLYFYFKLRIGVTCNADLLVSALLVTLISSKSRVYLLEHQVPVGHAACWSVEFSTRKVLVGRMGSDTMYSIPDPTQFNRRSSSPRRTHDEHYANITNHIIKTHFEPSLLAVWHPVTWRVRHASHDIDNHFKPSFVHLNMPATSLTRISNPRLSS